MPLFRPDKRIPAKALLKRFGLIYLPILAILFATLLWSVHFDEQRRMERTEARESSRIEIASGLISQDFREVDSDLRIIAALPALRWYLDSGDAVKRDELARLFLVLVGEWQGYDQIRYLDETGQEMVRVDHNGGKPVIVPREQLQNKSERYYFRDTIKFGKGEIFVSPLDLNIEQDGLETPYKPMIRFAAPVFDSAGRKKGVIVLNYLGSELIQRFRHTMRGGDSRHAMLLNRDGYWLSSSRPEDEWGFMLGRPDHTFGRTYPEAWRAVSANERGTVRTAKGLFTYSTVYPLLPGQHSSTGSALAHAPSQRALNGREYRWKIVSFVPQEVLSATAFHNQTNFRVFFVAGCIAAALAAWIIVVVTMGRAQARMELARSKARYDELVRSIPVGVYLLRASCDGKLAFEYVSPVFCRILNLDAGAVLRDAGVAFAAAHPDDRDHLIHSTREAIAAPRPYRWEGRFIVDGETRWIRISSDPTPQPDGGSLWSGVVSDISERKRIEADLRQSAEEIEDLYDRAPCGYHSLDQDGLIVRMNDTELKWLGYGKDEVIGKMHFPDLLTTASQHVFRESFPHLKEAGHARDVEFELIRKDGSVLPVLVNATAIYDSAGSFLMCRSTLFDMTERKKLERELERQARVDVLTGLNNRRHFFRLAETEIERSNRYGEPLTLLMLDLDNFKLVNDTYGHHVGDMVLKKLAEVCLGTVREIDIVGRLGGEEFSILLPEIDSTQGVEVAERLRESISRMAVPLEQGEMLSVTVSIGVTSFAGARDALSLMLRRADTALYAAKKAGRNQVCTGGAA